MSAPSQSLPIYIESGEQRLFALFDEVAGAPTRRPVLICAPWGWEETASYRCRRSIARWLNRAGHSTLRFDLPAVGDSSGRPEDRELLEAWIAAVGNAAAWLRSRSGADVAALGLGSGGLLALAAAAEEAPIEEAVLWATPANGRRFLREARSFALMQADGVGRGDETDLPEGWLEAGGFVLSAETTAALGGLDPGAPALRRALLLDRDGVDTDPSRRGSFEAAGIETTAESGAGWGEMVFHPEHAVFPAETVERIVAWLARAAMPPTAAPNAAVSAPADSRALRLREEDGDLMETPIPIPQSYGSAFAIASEPQGGRRADFCAVFLNAGAVRHVGPNRNWVESARRWAARGVPAVRVDLEGIGEADGDRSAYPGVAGFYDAVYGAQVVRVLDSLRRQGIGERFVCIGLCSGAYWSLQTAARDRRVLAAVMLNTGAIVWHHELAPERDWRELAGALVSRRSWAKLVRFEVDLRVKARFVGRLAAWRARQLLAWLRRLLGQPTARDGEDEVVALFDWLGRSDARVAMGFCSNEPVLAELEAKGITERLSEWPRIEVRPLFGEDHALGPIAAQRSGAELIDRELERVWATRGAGAAAPLTTQCQE